MPNINTRCPLCDKEVTYDGLNKHLTSIGHQEALTAALRKTPASDHHALLSGYRLPVARLRGHAFSICFGCPKAYHCDLQTTHLKSCKNREKHLEKLRTILQPAEGVDPLPEGGANNDEVMALRKEVDELKALLAARPSTEGGADVEKLRKELKEAEAYSETVEEELEQLNEKLKKWSKALFNEEMDQYGWDDYVAEKTGVVDENDEVAQEAEKSKKQYMESLEAELSRLRAANSKLEGQLKEAKQVPAAAPPAAPAARAPADPPAAAPTPPAAPSANAITWSVATAQLGFPEGTTILSNTRTKKTPKRVGVAPVI
jgi:chemotaxis protein histidine kinase CheA